MSQGRLGRATVRDFEGRHVGEPCVITANGWTFDKAQAALIETARPRLTVFGVNRSYELLWPDYHVAQDTDWFQNPWLPAMEELAAQDRLFSRPRLACGIPVPNARKRGKNADEWWLNWSDDLEFGIGPGSTAYYALQLASWMGFELISFVGLDLSFSPTGRTHCYGRHRLTQEKDRKFKRQHPQWAYGGGILQARGVRVMNSSPGSELKAFPYVPLEEFVKMAKEED